MNASENTTSSIQLNVQNPAALEAALQISLNKTYVAKPSISDAQLAGIVLAFLGVFFIVIALTYCICPVEILATLFGVCPKFYTLCPCKSGVKTNKQYKLFVSYNKSSEHWIRNQLVPFLDTKYLKSEYFLHYGEENKSHETFGELIKEKMENSCFIMMVLSDSFLINEWENKDYREHLKSLIVKVSKNSEEKTRFICIQLSSVYDEEMDEYVRDILQIPQFISLEAGEFYFWKKLGYFLYVNRDGSERILPVNKLKNDEITLTTRDKVRPNDLLYYKPHKIKAPIVHLPSLDSRTPVARKIKFKNNKEKFDNSDESLHSPSDYTSELVQKSILDQIARKKHSASEIVINLDKPITDNDLMSKNQNPLHQPVIVKTSDRKFKLAISDSDNNYRVIQNNNGFVNRNMPRLLSDDSNVDSSS